MLSYQRKVVNNFWLAWALLSAGLIATTVAAFYEKMDVEADIKREFDFACSEIQLRMGARMDAHAQVFRSATALLGWVYSPYQITDLMQSVMGGWQFEPGKRIRLQIFDNGQISPSTLVYDSQPDGGMEPATALRLTLQTSEVFNDHIWLLRFSQTDSPMISGRVYGVFFSGTIVSLLLFGLVISLLETRFRALQVADRLTADMKESEQSYRNQFAHSSVVMLLINPADGAIIDANTAATGFYGYPRERLPAMRITDINPMCGSERLQDMASVQQGQGQRFEFQHRLADGSLREVEVSSSRIQFGGRMVLHLIVHDITERKQAEKALRESEACLRVITDSAQDAILMMDTHGIISYWNPAAERILGYKRTEAIGQNLHAFIVPPRYYPAHQAAFSVFQQTGRGAAVGKTLDLEARRKDGAEISVQLSLSAVHMNGGWHAVGILRDITERKQAEAELLELNHYLEDATARANHMAAQAEMANAAKSEFLANMSHEIRTPMNGVIGMTGLLLDTDLNDEQRRYAEIVRTSGQFLLAIINDILDFSKIEAGKLEFETLDFDLRTVLSDFAAMLAIRAQEKGLEFTCTAPPDVPAYLRGDPGRLRQVLTNLAGNAIKFTHKGKIAVRAGLLSETDQEAQIRFSVQDTGIGIPEDKKDFLFQKFSQMDASTTRQYGGTGLGLAISKQLAGMMGGEIGVNSENGKGSEFWFTAWFTKQALQERVTLQKTMVARHTICEMRRGAIRILLAEDNIVNQQVALGILKKMGIRADAVANGAEAVKSLEILPYDLVLMDVQMPVMDGIEATKIIRHCESSLQNQETEKDTAHASLAIRNSSLPIIAMTAHTLKGDIEKCLNAGMNDYIPKPVDPALLAEVLYRWLEDKTEPGDRETGAQNDAPNSGIQIPVPGFRFQNTTIFDKADLVNRLLGDADLAITIIEGFLVDMPEQLSVIKELIAQGQAKEAGVQAHKIKGAAGNIGSPALQEIAHAMEQAANAEETNQLRILMPEMEKQFDKLKQAMEASRP